MTATHKTCFVCNATFLSPLAHPQHTKTQERLERAVRACFKRWRRRACALAAARKRLDGDEEWGEVVCGECLSVFETVDELDRHRDVAHSENAEYAECAETAKCTHVWARWERSVNLVYLQEEGNG